MAKKFLIEVICVQTSRLFNKHFDESVNTNDAIDCDVIARRVTTVLRKACEDIAPVEVVLTLSATDDSARKTEQVCYVQKGVYRFAGSLSFASDDCEHIKRCLGKVCADSAGTGTRILFTGDTEHTDLIHWLSKLKDLHTRQSFALNSFAMGSLVEHRLFVAHYHTVPTSAKQRYVVTDSIGADFMCDKRLLQLTFTVLDSSQRRHRTVHSYRLDFRYDSFKEAVFTIPAPMVIRIVIVVKQPPLLFRDVAEWVTGADHKPKWIRELELYGCEPSCVGKATALMLELPVIAITDALLKDPSAPPFRDIKDPFRILHMLKRFANIPINMAPVVERNGQAFNDALIRSDLISEVCPLIAPDCRFQLRYAFESIFAHTFQASDELFVNGRAVRFVETVLELVNSAKEWQTVEKALFQVSALVDSGESFNTIDALKELYVQLNAIYERMNTSFIEDLVNIRRVILTPTRVLLLPALPTPKSRFLENADPEYAIRLAVCEDDLKSIQYSLRHEYWHQKAFLDRVIKERLSAGIVIAGRRYEFVGSSSSQIRDAGMILYAEDSMGRTARHISDRIGDMSAFRRNVPKLVARTGLYFSHIMGYIPVPKTWTSVVRDIVRRRKGKEYTFSDGVGRISVPLMERVYEQLPYECGHRPSAIQIRYAGCKGMLVIDPELKDNQIIFRESMKKYESSDERLCVVKVSAPRPLYLNRPFITILEQLGVKARVFLNMLSKDLTLMANGMVCECTATPLLQMYSSLSIPYRRIYESGIPFLSEPLFMEVIDTVIKHRIQELLSKAKIMIPMSAGRTVFGVLDETGALEYGQVFVRLSAIDGNGMATGETLAPLKGTVMVTKFPCLHPGDVRKFTGVDIPALHHIRDCIVFPQKGPRPNPDEMAGSDLDGDEYAVVWNSPLIFAGDNVPAMVYPTPAPKLHSKDVTIDDIMDFYCDYLIGSNVGLLASAHLAQADRCKEGVFSDLCQSLAYKTSVAVDFSKTGTPIQIERKERPLRYPDFMQKFNEKRTYLSENILGQMYRHCERFSLGIHSCDEHLAIVAIANPDLIIEGCETFKKSALNAYNEYKFVLNEMLRRFGVESEAALISGAYSRTSKYMTGRSERNDAVELLRSRIQRLFKLFSQRFDSECADEYPGDECRRRQRASAWYSVPFVCAQKSDAGEQRYGFSWTIAEEICKLMASKSTSGAHKHSHNCYEKAIDSIDGYISDIYTHLEANDDNPVDDENERWRQIMDMRLEAAELVVIAWLERQEHMNIYGTDTYRKLKGKLAKMRDTVMCDGVDDSEESPLPPLKTVGALVMEFLDSSLNQWLGFQFMSAGARSGYRSCDSPLVKFGFWALITIRHFFIRREMPQMAVPLSAPKCVESLYLHLPSAMNRWEGNDPLCRRFEELMCQQPERVRDVLMDVSGAQDICLEPYLKDTQTLQYYFLLTSVGTQLSLQVTKNYIYHPAFIRSVLKSVRSGGMDGN